MSPLTARRGEILALYGLMGSGRTEIFNSIFGLDKKNPCQLLLNGEVVKIGSPSQAIENGIALVTEDRKGSGLIMSETVRANICLAELIRLRLGPFMGIQKEKNAARAMIDMFRIKTATDQLLVSELSWRQSAESSAWKMVSN